MSAVQARAEVTPGAGLAARRVVGGFGIEYGPLPEVAAERARLDGLTWPHFDVRRLGATVGAELIGLDLTTELADPVIAEIARALDEYKVIFFRDQPLTPAQHVAFARRFGELEVHPFFPSNTEEPALVRFAKNAEVGGYENNWHHDVTWRAVPSRAAVLHAVEVPEFGGDTLFADMVSAYAGLDDATKELIERLDAVHDFTHSFGAGLSPERLAAMQAEFPPVRHPLACTHDRTGRKHLYANPVFTAHVADFDRSEGDALIARLARRATIPEYQCRFHWEPHSVAFWDNRAVQHYAASDYWPERRVMERASIVGTRPVR